MFRHGHFLSAEKTCYWKAFWSDQVNFFALLSLQDSCCVHLPVAVLCRECRHHEMPVSLMLVHGS